MSTHKKCSKYHQALELYCWGPQVGAHKMGYSRQPRAGSWCDVAGQCTYPIPSSRQNKELDCNLQGIKNNICASTSKWISQQIFYHAVKLIITSLRNLDLHWLEGRKFKTTKQQRIQGTAVIQGPYTLPSPCDDWSPSGWTEWYLICTRGAFSKSVWEKVYQRV